MYIKSTYMLNYGAKIHLFFQMQQKNAGLTRLDCNSNRTKADPVRRLATEPVGDVAGQKQF